ncbi:DNA polymerase III subunit gamma/tau [Bacteroidetes bacterium endosymbiont of Geopemphigus sp.]|uniref:DNA polymerase III subunit gamma/tau n=1 Tax=Bacteroidetes bacterium endosymbiont of Geopemphigus sp. TaxID=2047937 RepID=UPI000CD07C4F|nr:DNA polymerase III subunit gamma/tau [Bacteroidetes bacterium endosymbiont of Geopemphigus sp.]
MQKQVYVVSSRKYRPADFEDVVGQKSITDTLDRAIRSGRLAQALLFCGPRGVGKTTCARILAKKINGLYQTSDSISNDFNIFELDAASNNSVDGIRALIDQLRFAPQQGRYKIYIIDEVHMLSQAAFNAFLKTLEEPPAHAIFVLATTEKHKVLSTILSRCQVYDFRRISLEDIYKQLEKIAKAEGIKTEQEALHLIAQRADGALRDALSIFDRLISFSGKNLTSSQVREQLGILDQEYYFKATELILIHDIRAVLALFNEILQEGFDGRIFIAGLAEHLRHLMMASGSKSLSLIEMPEAMQARYIEQASYTSTDFLLKALQVCQRAEMDSKLSLNSRLSLEISLMQLTSFGNANTQGEKKNNIPLHSGVLSKIASNANEMISGSKLGIPSSASVTSPKEKPFQRKVFIKEISKSVKKEPLLSPSGTLSDKTWKKSPVEGSASVSFSIREALKDPLPATSAVVETPLAKESYSKKDFRKAWEAFSRYQIPSENSSLRHVLSAVEYEFSEDNLVILYFSSRAALTEFSTICEPILNHLRYHLNNFHLYFETRVKAFQEKKTVYTPEEKFAFLSKKNPQLERLKEALSLDFYD